MRWPQESAKRRTLGKEEPHDQVELVVWDVFDYYLNCIEFFKACNKANKLYESEKC